MLALWAYMQGPPRFHVDLLKGPYVSAQSGMIEVPPPPLPLPTNFFLELLLHPTSQEKNVKARLLTNPMMTY